MISVAPRRGARMSAGLYDGLIVDLFAGGGGASVGIEAAMGRSVDIAVNHDPVAVAMHAVNHPHTSHLQTDVFEVDPVVATGGRRVDLLWASPDCTYHSKARGAKPIRSKQARRRALAWVVIKWASRVRPSVIMLENVEEFADWCPLVPRRHANGKVMKDDDGAVLLRPCERRKGATFRRWVRELRALGYAVEWRELRACDYGSPTIRKRLYVIARCDGQPIVWPERTHGPAASGRRGRDRIDRRGVSTNDAGDLCCSRGRSATARDLSSHGESRRRPWRVTDVESDTGERESRCNRGGIPTALKPFRTAAECIDWSLPCPSIFLTREEARALGLKVQRPLKPATMKRMARGVKKYVLDAAKPFIVLCNHGGEWFRGHGVEEPLGTVTCSRDARGVVVPFIAGAGGPGYSGKPVGVDAPLGTIQTENHRAVVAPFTVPRYGERDGQAPRCGRVDRPAPTIVPKGNGAQLVAPALINVANSKTTGRGPNAWSVEEPVRTMTASPGHAVVAAYLAQHNGGMVGHAADKPLSTITQRGTQQQVVAAYVAQHNGGNVGSEADVPLGTITTTGGQQQIVAASLSHLYTSNTAGGQGDPGAPIKTITTGNHAALVYSFLASYCGVGIGQDVRDPMRTIPTHERFAVVMVDGTPRVICDIGMRMLTPRELFRCQGFDDSYVIDLVHNGKRLTKGEQTRLVGNSVCPQVAEAIVRANVPMYGTSVRSGRAASRKAVAPC